MDLQQLKEQVQEAIKKADRVKDLEMVFQKFLGKKGKLTELFHSLGALPPEQRKEVGRKVNQLKEGLRASLEQKTQFLKARDFGEGLKTESLDITRPGKKLKRGHLHPLTLVQRDALEIFQSMGFSIVLGPEVETEWYNFDALNVPKDHPARDMWDTFWLRQNETKNQEPKTKNQKDKLLLRTHTSPVQIRYLETHQPPLRIVVPGRVFRHERTDASHDVQFYQLEGLMVDKNISAANFKAIIQEFFQRFFKSKVDIRLRPSFFPFTEPSFEIDIKRGRGRWLEMLGAGMVHPNVFKASGLNPKDWQGFAFGVGLDRLTMLRYKLNDIRLFYQNDLRFLKQF